MTEAFATTVAAVAPVIWLVAAVEYQQVTKRYGESVNAQEAALERELRALESGTGAAASEEDDASASVSPIRVILTLAVWCILSAFLAGVTLVALDWLATPKAGPRPGVALLCYWTICAGLCIVTVFPVCVVLWDAGVSNFRRVGLQVRIRTLRAPRDPHGPFPTDADPDGDAAGSPSP